MSHFSGISNSVLFTSPFENQWSKSKCDSVCQENGEELGCEMNAWVAVSIFISGMGNQVSFFPLLLWSGWWVRLWALIRSSDCSGNSSYCCFTMPKGELDVGRALQLEWSWRLIAIQCCLLAVSLLKAIMHFKRALFMIIALCIILLTGSGVGYTQTLLELSL